MYNCFRCSFYNYVLHILPVTKSECCITGYISAVEADRHNHKIEILCVSLLPCEQTSQLKVRKTVDDDLSLSNHNVATGQEVVG